MKLSKEQNQRYLRHIALDGVGASGQSVLLESKVLVVGAGGLGSPVLLYLAASGVGHLAVIDNDKVSLSNLQRQILFDIDGIGELKVEQAHKKILALNPEVKFVSYNQRLDDSNASEIISKYDLIVDASDNFATRFIVNKYALKLRKTLVWAAVHEFLGQVGVVKFIGNKNTPCFECFCPSNFVKKNNLPDCTSGGVLGSIVGVVGSLQATEVIKELLDLSVSLSGNILIYDGLKQNLRKVKLNYNNDCAACHAINV